MKGDEKNSNNRPEAYPKPTETDTQLNHQPEYSEPYANRFDDQGNVSTELEQDQLRMRGEEDKNTQKEE